MARSSKPAPDPTWVESLQTPFNVRLYGRVVEGISVDRQHLNGRISDRVALRALWAQARSSKGPVSGLAEAASGWESEQSAARLANVYGYVRGNSRTILPRPLTFLVDDEGEDASGWDSQFSGSEGFKSWEVEPQEPTYRFDVQPGVFNELLLAGESPGVALAGATEPDGGTVIRGADNRLYLIPLALEPFEIQDPREISDLQLQAQQYGREIKVDSVRGLTGRSTLVARSTLQVRSTLNLRSTLAGAHR